MSQRKEKKLKVPVLYYEEPDEGEAVNPFPYIEVGKDDPWPFILFIQEYRHTGEFEPGADGEECPVVDMIIHKFVDMEHLKEKLDPETNDKVRVALGMQPLKEAQASGEKILGKVMQNVNANKEEKSRKVQELNNKLKTLNNRFEDIKKEMEKGKNK